MKRRSKWILCSGLAAITAGIATVVWAQAEPEKKKAPAIEPQADRVLRGMCDYLANLPAFSFTAESVDEIVLKTGQKLQFPASSQVYVQRPNRIRSDRLGVPLDVSLYYDGSKMSLFGRRANLYATNPAPKHLDQAIDFARKRLQIDAPGADLLYAKPYPVLTEDVVAGKYLAKEQMDGAVVHHLAFEGNETNWEIWIQEGPRPLPRRFVITSKKVMSFPQFTVDIKDWNVAPLLSAEMFAFKPSESAKQIDFDKVWEKAAEAQQTQREEVSSR